MSMPNVADNGDPISAAIDAAEEVRDPLDDLVETTTADPGAAFMPEVLERLAALRRDDRAAFESLRAQLKRAGCRVTALDQTINEESGEAGRGPTQADVLIDLAQTAELFHTPGEGPFRCAGTHGPCSRRRGGRSAVPRPVRRNLARGGDRCHGLARG